MYLFDPESQCILSYNASTSKYEAGGTVIENHNPSHHLELNQIMAALEASCLDKFDLESLMVPGDGYYTPENERITLKQYYNNYVRYLRQKYGEGGTPGAGFGMDKCPIEPYKSCILYNRSMQ